MESVLPQLTGWIADLASCPTTSRTKEDTMEQNEAQVFSGITPEQYAKLKEKAREADMDIAGNNGTASQFGVEVAWNYVPATQQLTLRCLKTPFFIGVAEVNAKIRALVNESRG
jgi:hypothetical protein